MADSVSSQDEGQRPSAASGLEVLAGGTARDLRTLQVKLTHVGMQSKPVPSVVFTTFYHIVRMEWFVPLRKPGLHYNNDEIALWNFTVTPEEVERIVKSLHKSATGQAAQQTQGPYLSLMLALRESRLGQHDYEAVFSQDQSAIVIQTITDALNADNGMGRKVMALRQQVVG